MAVGSIPEPHRQTHTDIQLGAPHFHNHQEHGMMQERMKPHMTEQSLAGQNQTAQYNAGQWSLWVLLKTFPHFTRIYIFFVPFALEKTRFNEMQSILCCFLLVRGIANSWFSWLSVVVSHNASKYSRMSWAANFYVSFPCQKKEKKKKRQEKLRMQRAVSFKWEVRFSSLSQYQMEEPKQSVFLDVSGPPFWRWLRSPSLCLGADYCQDFSN